MTRGIVEAGPGADRRIVCLEQACKALAEAKTAEDVEEIRDQAQAMLHYYQQREYGLAAINDAAEIKVRAERRLGQILGETVRPGGSHNQCNIVLHCLPDGISRMQSSRWQAISRIPDRDFETHIAEVRGKEQELTTAGVLRLAKALSQPGKKSKPPLSRGCRVEDLRIAAESGKRFGTIYADPPWSYSNQATRASTDNHYQTMTVDEIAALPIGELAAPCCHLHLWTTNAFLFDCPRIFDAWGFKYQGVFVWCKPQMGIGNCWRVSHEFLLLAIRGEPRSFDVHDLKSWAAYDRDKHSSKPEQIRHMIEKASPSPYLELFARHEHENWSVWGNEIDSDLFTSSLEAS